MIVELVMIEKLLIAALFGGLVGVERQMHEKPAGLRTHVLVCTGATLFTIVSLSFSEWSAAIAAGVVTGIGFIAAGSIFKERDNVKGLTTAADLWVIAAIGLSIGIGYYVVAAFATAITLGILLIGRVLDNYLDKRARVLGSKKRPPFI